MDSLTASQFALVYNAFSFGIATFAAATLFFWFGRSQVSHHYKTAITVTGLVTFIAAYHYWRIFNSWSESYEVANGVIAATGIEFNRAYRYVDWLLTVPLLLIELILVMRLSQAETVSKSIKLGGAAALMILLGYPGEVSAGIDTTRLVFGALSMIPFLYIVYTLYSSLGEAIERQHASVRNLIRLARNLTVVSWFFYPVVYFLPFVFRMNGGTSTAVIELGYTIADITAKAVFGLVIFAIAVRKSEAEGFKA